MWEKHTGAGIGHICIYTRRGWLRVFGVLTKKREGFEGDQDGADEAGLQEELGRQENDED